MISPHKSDNKNLGSLYVYVRETLMSKNEFLRRNAIAAAAAMVIAIGALPPAAYAQQQPVYPQQPPAYPQQQPAYPQQPPDMGQPMAQQMQPPKAHPIRELFAGTLATLLQVTGASVTAGLTQAVTGGISSWFNKKAGAGQYAQGYPQQGYPTTPTYPTTSPTYPTTSPTYPTTTPTYPTTSPTYPTTTPTYPTTTPTYPTTATATNPYAAQNPYATSTASAYPSTPTQVYDARTGQMSTAAGTPYATPSGGSDGTMYAGIAYEVHAIGAGGVSTPVNPATYIFHSGDRFMVHYRPSMPGRMEVFNINPAGQQTRIDATNMAAGQLASLGPYEFSNMTGDESLRIVLSPCSTQQLLVATRDIVNVSATAGAASAVQLGNCGTTSRGLDVKTRDIRKVAVDGGTAFALDPVSRQELSSGQITAREVNIVFHHR
jgi:hypothetical protein